MSTQTQTQIQAEQIQLQELNHEQIKKLLELAVKEGRLEGRYLLVLQTWRRQGSSYEDKADFEIILGEIDSITIREWDEGYPHRKGFDYIIIPKTIPVVILWFHKWDYGTESGESAKVYIFTADGWKSVCVK